MLTPLSADNSLKLRPSNLVCDKHLALLVGQFVDGELQFLQQHLRA